MSKVMLRKNKKLIATFNDPSDVEDYLINQGLPKALFLKKYPDKGWSWDDLPLRFGWETYFYSIERMVELNGQPYYPLTKEDLEDQITGFDFIK